MNIESHKDKFDFQDQLSELKIKYEITESLFKEHSFGERMSCLCKIVTTNVL